MGEIIVRQPEKPSADELSPAEAGFSPDGGVALCRLLAVATLTPAQAGLLALDLVSELEDRHRHDRHCGRVGVRAATVSAAGQLRLLPEDSGVAEEGAVPGRDGEQWRVAVTEAAALIRRLVVNTRRSGPRRRSESVLLADRMDGPIAHITDLAQRVREAVAEIVGTGDAQRTRRTRQELAALVVATRGRPVPPERDPFAVKCVAPVAPVPLVVSRTAVLAPGGWRPSSRHAWHRRRRSRPRKSVLIGLVVVVLGVLGWWGVPRAWTEVQRGWEAVFIPENPSQQFAPVSQPPAPEPTQTAAPRAENQEPRTVERPAPAAADPITDVTIERVEGRCIPGEVCPIRVDVHLRSAGTARQVSWSLQVVDRCSGTVETQQGVSMTAEAGWRQVYGISRPQLPGGTALAVLAVTESPARAASEPLLVPATGPKC